jgi:hypothetical protein
MNDRELRKLMIDNHMNLENAINQYFTRYSRVMGTEDKQPLTTNSADHNTIDLTAEGTEDNSDRTSVRSTKKVGAKPKVWSTYPKVEVKPVVESAESPTAQEDHASGFHIFRRVGQAYIDAYRYVPTADMHLSGDDDGLRLFPCFLFSQLIQWETACSSGFKAPRVARCFRYCSRRQKATND